MKQENFAHLSTQLQRMSQTVKENNKKVCYLCKIIYHY